jgi:hypothetical protein
MAPSPLGWSSVSIAGVLAVVHALGMVGLRPQPEHVRVPASEEASPAGGSLTPVTERLMRSAAAVRRASGQPQRAADLSVALGHVEQALDDLSAGVGRVAHANGESEPQSGGVAWRLHTLRHALHAARDLCAGARDAVPSVDARPDGSMRLVDDPSSA